MRKTIYNALGYFLLIQCGRYIERGEKLQYIIAAAIASGIIFVIGDHAKSKKHY